MKRLYLLIVVGLGCLANKGLAQQQGTITVIGEEIVVTATRIEKPVEESPAAVTVVASKDLEKSTARTVDEALKYTPGLFHWQRIGLSEPHPFIFMRGFTGSSRNLSLMDGVSINDAGNSMTRWHVLPPENIERIEVARGPFSALYGGGAMGGVVHIITKTPMKREFSSNVSYGIYNSQLYKLRYGDRFRNKLSFSLGYEGRRTDGYPNKIVTKEATRGNVGTPATGWERTRDPQGEKTIYIIGDRGKEHLREDIFYGKMSFDITPKSNISFSLNHSNRDVEMQDYKAYLKDAAGNPIDIGTITFSDGGRPMTMTVKPGDFLLRIGGHWRKQTIFSAKYSNEITEGTTLRVNLGVNDVDHNILNPGGNATLTGGVGELSGSRDRSYHNDIQITFPLRKRHILTGGVSYSHLWNERSVWSMSNWRDKGSKINIVTETEGKNNLFAIYLQDEILLHEKTTLYLGGRYDYWKVSDGRVFRIIPPPVREEISYPAQSDSFFSPKASIHYKPFENTILRVSAGQSFRPPTIHELYGRFFHFPDRWILGTSNLQPERANSWELGLTQFNGKTLFSTTYFESYIDDMIGSIVTKTDPATGRPIELQHANVARAKIRGIETEMKQKLTESLSSFANFTWQDAVTKENPADRPSEGKQLTSIPKIMCNFGVAFSKNRFDANVVAKYAGKIYSRGDNRDIATGVPWGYDPIIVTDLKLAYQITKMAKVSLDVNNLFDNDYYFMYKSPGREMKATFTLIF